MLLPLGFRHLHRCRQFWQGPGQEAGARIEAAVPCDSLLFAVGLTHIVLAKRLTLRASSQAARVESNLRHRLVRQAVDLQLEDHHWCHSAHNVAVFFDTHVLAMPDDIEVACRERYFF